MNGRCLSAVAALGAIAPLATAIPATLRVPSEYPTIQAGIDTAASGDTVLVAPGRYIDYEVRPGPVGTGQSAVAHLRGGVVLMSEAGPETTTMELVAGEYLKQVVAKVPGRPGTDLLFMTDHGYAVMVTGF